MPADGFFRPPPAVNEPVRAYLPGSAERASLRGRLRQMEGERAEMPCIIGGRDVTTGDLRPAVMPHRHAHVLGEAHMATAGVVEQAIDAALKARREWAAMPFHDRASIFLRAADLLSGPWRDTVNAATMLGQSKTVHQAEIDAAAELCDFFRFNVEYASRIYADQPISSPGVWNRLEYRPLEGFVLAIAPFNFTSIAGNLPASAALMGNTVVWKAAETASLSAHHLMRLFEAAGVPPGVINLVHGDGPTVGAVATAHRDLAGIHFTGSTEVFRSLWRQVADRLDGYRGFPRLVGETGGKNFVLVHPSADAAEVVTGVVRGAFEYQGQKCSAASRLFVPASLWPAVSKGLQEEVASIRMGDVADFGNFMGAVIDREAWDRHRDAIEEARRHPDTAILAGGEVDDSEGYFVSPTVIATGDPDFSLLKRELFGPIVTAFVYEDGRWADTIDLIDRQTPYALTGAVFAHDRAAVLEAERGLVNAAGNFYVNDKPTGAVVGQQPFGGARASGTNDKAGSLWNLIRWVSPRAVKEALVSPTDYRYPFLSSDA